MMPAIVSAGTVARRIVALFVLCGLLPVAATIVVSYGYVEETLVEQRVAVLRGAASNYATVLFDRLSVAERLASSMVENKGVGRQLEPTALERHFRAGVAIGPAGARTLFGAPSNVPGPSDIAATDRPLLDGAGRVLVLRDPATKPSVWVIVKNAPEETRAPRLAFELNPSYLFEADDDLPYLTEVCVLNAAGLPIQCDRKPTAAEFNRFRHAPAGTRHTDFAWESGGVSYLSGIRELFLGGRFGADSWVVVASQPEEHALAPVRALIGVAVPIVVLGLLVAALLGLVHVRRTMQPLNELTQAAGRIAASDFDVRVTAARGDEFGVLASSFNTMSARLGRQFNLLRAESEVDAVILSSADLARVVTIILQRVAEMGSADRYSLLLADPATSGAYRLYSVNDEGGLRMQSVELPREELERLRVARRGLRFVPFEAESLPVLAGVEGTRQLAFAFLLGEEFAGAFVLGYDGDRVPGSEDASMLSRLGDRVAVALGTARRDLELHRRAYYDSLTQLPNRLLGLEELNRAVATCARQRRELAVLFIDLDGFSYVNDSLGHPAGDGVLVRTAARLRACVRKSDIVMRLGGDEFAVVLSELRNSTDAAVAARHVISALAPPFELPEGRAHISGSVGIALFPQDGRTTEELVKHADLAMYHAKQQGTGGMAFFEASMNEEIRRRVELERELREALDTQQMRLYFQPQLDLRSGRIVGAEALIRWMHPIRGMVAPSHFIEFAESSALIEEIGQWALKTACAQIVAWRTEGLAIEYVSVNVSPRQFQAGGFAETVAEALRAYDVPANALHLEVTESAVLGDQGAAHANFEALNALGTPLELDDFGTGYSSLAHLRHLPVAVVKLDRAFISAIHHDASALAVVRAAIDMAHALGKVVVAEGVELTEQVLLLSQIGCDILQGYHLSAAVPAEAFATLVRERATDSAPVEKSLLRDVVPSSVRGQRGSRESRT